MSGGFALYWNTVRRLHPEQIRHRIARSFRDLGGGNSLHLAGEPRERALWRWRSRRVRVPLDRGLLEGRYRFWGEERVLDLRHRWEAGDLGRSWNYPVHYFDAAPAVAENAARTQDVGERDALCRAIDLWIEAHPMGTSIGWEAYPTALRIVNWIDVLWALNDWCDAAWRARVLASLHRQAGWVEAHLERHLLGTHLLKDAKALVFAGKLFGGPDGARWAHRGAAIVGREMHGQVHPDGGHLEPSLLYHGLALEDFLDVLNLGALDPVEAGELRVVVARMLDVLVATLPPDGRWSLRGDAARDGTPQPNELLDYARRLGLNIPGASPDLRCFPDSGLAVWRDERSFLLADVGPIGPPHLAAHGHCDSLSFEWFVDGMPIVVDTGVRTYEPGPERLQCRSTRAHNTLEIDGCEQHEIWAAFRVARRSEVTAERVGESGVNATLVPWHDERLQVSRGFDFAAGAVRIADRVEGPGRHRIVSRLHLHPDCSVVRDASRIVLRNGKARAALILPDAGNVEILDAERSGSEHCESFGRGRPNAVVCWASEGDLPWRTSFELRPL